MFFSNNNNWDTTEKRARCILTTLLSLTLGLAVTLGLAGLLWRAIGMTTQSSTPEQAEVQCHTTGVTLTVEKAQHRVERGSPYLGHRWGMWFSKLLTVELTIVTQHLQCLYHTPDGRAPINLTSVIDAYLSSNPPVHRTEANLTGEPLTRWYYNGEHFKLVFLSGLYNEPFREDWSLFFIDWILYSILAGTIWLCCWLISALYVYHWNEIPNQLRALLDYIRVALEKRARL